MTDVASVDDLQTKKFSPAFQSLTCTSHKPKCHKKGTRWSISVCSSLITHGIYPMDLIIRVSNKKLLIFLQKSMHSIDGSQITLQMAICAT
jgi:hypothetical protein